MKFQERRVGLLTNPEGCALLCLGVIYKICAFRGCQRPFVEDRWRPFRRVAKSLRLAVRYEVLMGRGLNHYHYRVEKWAMKWYWFSARNILWLSNSAAMESRPNCYNRTYDICPLRFRLGSAAISARSKNDPSASDGLREIKTSESPLPYPQEWKVESIHYFSYVLLLGPFSLFYVAGLKGILLFWEVISLQSRIRSLQLSRIKEKTITHAQIPSLFWYVSENLRGKVCGWLLPSGAWYSR